jgi:hypothetical protein
MCRGSGDFGGLDIASGCDSVGGGATEGCSLSPPWPTADTESLACRSFKRRRLAARISFCSLSCIDFVYARCILSRLAAKSTGPTSTIFLGFGSLFRVIFMPVLTCCGDPDRSAAFCLELAVDAEETGCRGLELRRGGDVFGGGAEMYAFRLELFMLSFSGLFALPRGE